MKGIPKDNIVLKACTDSAYGDWEAIGNCTLIDREGEFIDAEWEIFPERYYRVRSD